MALRRYSLSTEKTVSTLYTTSSRVIDNMSLSGDYIYIVANGYDNSIIYKINTKTKKRTTVYKYKSGKKEESSIEDMVYYKGNIYYTVYNDKDSYNENDDTCEVYKIGYLEKFSCFIVFITDSITSLCLSSLFMALSTFLILV